MFQLNKFINQLIKMAWIFVSFLKNTPGLLHVSGLQHLLMVSQYLSLFTFCQFYPTYGSPCPSASCGSPNSRPKTSAAHPPTGSRHPSERRSDEQRLTAASFRANKGSKPFRWLFLGLIGHTALQSYPPFLTVVASLHLQMLVHGYRHFVGARVRTYPFIDGHAHQSANPAVWTGARSQGWKHPVRVLTARIADGQRSGVTPSHWGSDPVAKSEQVAESVIYSHCLFSPAVWKQVSLCALIFKETGSVCWLQTYFSDEKQWSNSLLVFRNLFHSDLRCWYFLFEYHIGYL